MVRNLRIIYPPQGKLRCLNLTQLQRRPPKNERLILFRKGKNRYPRWTKITIGQKTITPRTRNRRSFEKKNKLFSKGLRRRTQNHGLYRNPQWKGKPNCWIIKKNSKLRGKIKKSFKERVRVRRRSCQIKCSIQKSTNSKCNQSRTRTNFTRISLIERYLRKIQQTQNSNCFILRFDHNSIWKIKKPRS